ncbi:unnamed protein product, partial [Iphiclides podalirius]
MIAIVVCTVAALLALTSARPDSAGQPPLPGPGLSYGGIPYGSMSGNVADFFRKQTSPGARSLSHAGPGYDVNYAPIEQWL